MTAPNDTDPNAATNADPTDPGPTSSATDPDALSSVDTLLRALHGLDGAKPWHPPTKDTSQTDGDRFAAHQLAPHDVPRARRPDTLKMNEVPAVLVEQTPVPPVPLTPPEPGPMAPPSDELARVTMKLERPSVAPDPSRLEPTVVPRARSRGLVPGLVGLAIALVIAFLAVALTRRPTEAATPSPPPTALPPPRATLEAPTSPTASTVIATATASSAPVPVPPKASAPTPPPKATATPPLPVPPKPTSRPGPANSSYNSLFETDSR